MRTITGKQRVLLCFCLGLLTIAIGFMLSNALFQTTNEISIQTKNRIFLTKINLLKKYFDGAAPTMQTVRSLLEKEELHDPYTYRPMRLTSGTLHYKIYSLGPDLRDDHATTSYDPTNGLKSRGDLIFQIYLDGEL